MKSRGARPSGELAPSVACCGFRASVIIHSEPKTIIFRPIKSPFHFVDLFRSGYSNEIMLSLVWLVLIETNSELEKIIS